MMPVIESHALLGELARCPQCETYLRADDSCACGYSLPADKPVGLDLAEVNRRYEARVQAHFNQQPLRSKWWADRILERHARGEEIPILLFEWAKACALKP
jgi:hypothetical protein